jgi:hypothetical protein
MATTAEQLRQGRRTLQPQPGVSGTLKAGPRRSVLDPWLRGQAINITRHAAALHPFQKDEFGRQAAAPTEGHIEAVNKMITQLRASLLRKAAVVSEAVHAARSRSTTRNLQAVVTYKERGHDWVRAIEKVWDFYFELFGQRQSRFGDWLLSCDRIALDCYQVAFMGVTVPKSIPAPPPFSYMRTGFSPATFRRGIPLKRLGHSLNPFPLIQLPYHRLVNPWTLGAILHEVSHNTQNDLGLAEVIPHRIGQRLQRAGLERSVSSVWVRWNRETFADLSGLLLGGPAVVASLMDVIGRAPRTVKTYSSRGPHPTPYLRAFISFELLRRMGFENEAQEGCRLWSRCYPNPRSGTIPSRVLHTASQAIKLVVDQVCYQPYETLGNKCLAEVIKFGPKEQLLIEEAGKRLAAGNDPGIIPERFLIGAARYAFDRELARPDVIKENFYRELARR